MAKRNRRKRRTNRAGSEGQIELPGTAAEVSGPSAEEPFALEPPPEPEAQDGSDDLSESGDNDPGLHGEATSPDVAESRSPSTGRGGPKDEGADTKSSSPPKQPATTYASGRQSKPPGFGAGPALSVEALVEAGEYRRAIPMLETSLEERPEDIELLVRSGRVFTAVGDYDRAQVLFHRAMELAPDDLSVRKEAGIAMYRRGLYSESAELLAIVCARSERDGEAYFYRGEALNRSGQSEEAARAMEKASALLPDDERPLMSLGRIFDRLGMVEEAGQMYGRVRALARKRAAAEDA